MDKLTAQTVLPVFRHGLLIKEKQRRGEPCKMSEEQAELKRLLRQVEISPQAASPQATDVFLGIRYPLVCWLDEIFIVDDDSPWRGEWKNQILEFDQFGRRNRAYEFWEQARLAEASGDANALEVFYLCVMLGFRGDKREDFNGLLEWKENVKDRIVQGQSFDWPDKPQELPVPPTNAFPLVWRDRLRLMMLTGAVVIGVAIEAAVLLVVLKWH